MKFLSFIFFIEFLLVFGCQATQDQSTECPSCFIPCAPSSSQVLVRTFSHLIEGCSLIIVLDATTGEAKLMYSNKTGGLYIKTFLAEGYQMNQLCELFSSVPNLTPPNSERNYVLVVFNFFPRQRLTLIDEAEARYLYLFQRSRLLVHKQKGIIELLNRTVHKHESFEKKLLKKIETINLENSKKIEALNTEISRNFSKIATINLENSKRSEALNTENYRNFSECNQRINTLGNQYTSLKSTVTSLDTNLQQSVSKSEMRKKLEYAVSKASISGRGYHCRPSSYKLQFPRTARNNDLCLIFYPNWLYFDLAEEILFNRIQLYHFDADHRTVTFNIQISRDRVYWTSVASTLSGKRLSDIRLSRLYQARYIRMQGTSTVHSNFALHWVKFDWV